MSAVSNFWTTPTGGDGRDPKRQYRFLVYLNGMASGATWYAKSCKKPEITISSIEHNYLNHKFYYPGRVEWGEVSVVLVDPVSPDAAAQTAKIIQASGYSPPATPNDTTTISKAAAVQNLVSVIIQQIDGKGAMVEQWTLQNAFIIGVSYGDLDYSGDDLTEITLNLRYDWAELKDSTDKEWFAAVVTPVTKPTPT